MPIEIRELNIKATVSDEQPTQARQNIDLKAFKQKLLAECVEEVLQIIEEKKDR